MENYMKNKAFTLAEVLVTLGIIGVVSAMTLPTLVKNHQRQVYVTQLRTIVNQMSQAVEKAVNDNNAMSLDETKYSANNDNGAREFFNDYFKVVKNCGSDLTPCFASNYKNLDGSNFTLETPISVVTLANGVSISNFANWWIFDTVPFCTDANGNKYDCRYHGYYRLQIDVNGQQGPNVLGRDLFYMELYSDGVVAETRTGDLDWQAEKCSVETEYGLGCLSKIMQDGWKMDY